MDHPDEMGEGMGYLPLIVVVPLLLVATALVLGLMFVIVWGTVQTVRDRRARSRWEASLGMDYEIRTGRAGDSKSVWDRDLDD
jgi:hypothetical protein